MDNFEILKKVNEQATPGPFVVQWEHCDCGGDYPCHHGWYPLVLQSTTAKVERSYAKGILYSAEIADFMNASDCKREDTNTVVAAVNSLSSLTKIAELARKLSAEIADLKVLDGNSAFVLRQVSVEQVNSAIAEFNKINLGVKFQENIDQGMS